MSTETRILDSKACWDSSSGVCYVSDSLELAELRRTSQVVSTTRNDKANLIWFVLSSDTRCLIRHLWAPSHSTGVTQTAQDAAAPFSKPRMLRDAALAHQSGSASSACKLVSWEAMTGTSPVTEIWRARERKTQATLILHPFKWSTFLLSAALSFSSS